MDLQDVAVDRIEHAGLQAAAILRGRGIETVGDLLARAPRRYVDLCGADDWTVVRQSVVGATVAPEGIVCAATVARSMASALARADQWSHPVSHVLAKELGLRSSAEALLAIHAPDRNTSVDELIALQRGVSWAHKSLGFEELPAVAVVLERATARILARGLISTAEDAG